MMTNNKSLTNREKQFTILSNEVTSERILAVANEAISKALAEIKSTRKIGKT